MSGGGQRALWLGLVLVTLTALFHLSGYVAIPVDNTVGRSPDIFALALRPLWVIAGGHWLLIAAVCYLVSRPARKTRTILQFCACAMFADAAVLTWLIGPFIGAVLLAAAGIAILAASLGCTAPPAGNS